MREFLNSWLGNEASTKRQAIGIGVIVLLIALVSSVLGEEDAQGIGLLVVAIGLYFAPALIARKKPNANTVFVINLFLGWTLVGWVVALAMAVNNPTAPPAAPPSQQPEPTGRTCPFCAEDIKPEAIVCKHCGRDLPKDD